MPEAVMPRSLWETPLLTFALFMVAISLPANSKAASLLEEVKGQKVAVAVFAQHESVKAFSKTVQSRFESILTDNGVTILDEAAVADLKNVWKKLEDPGYVVTAEEFIQNSEKYQIQMLSRVFITATASPGLADYYSATAQADIRFIKDKDARAIAATGVPMGGPGNPPSDGISKDSAIINALYRSLETSCAKIGFEVSDPTQARLINIGLEGPFQINTGRANHEVERDSLLGKIASLQDKTWRTEEITCTARDPSGNLGAVAGYIIDTDFHRKPQRMYGSKMHIVDVKNGKENTVLECHEIGFGGSGTRRILDCTFLANWIHLAAVSGTTLFLWNVEQGRLIDSKPLTQPLESGTICYQRSEEGVVLIVNGKNDLHWAYKLIRRK
jgi:hypothetical protein